VKLLSIFLPDSGEEKRKGLKTRRLKRTWAWMVP